MNYNIFLIDKSIEKSNYNNTLIQFDLLLQFDEAQNVIYLNFLKKIIYIFMRCVLKT